MSLEMAQKVIVPQKKKIMSRSFLNSGTLTVIISFMFFRISKSSTCNLSLEDVASKGCRKTS
jgi:hypothetical protein